MITLILKEAASYSAPGPTLGASLQRDYKAGQAVMISYFNWPSKPYEPGTIGTSLHPEGHTSWSFWTNSDIDCAIIFSAKDVGKIVCPDTPFYNDVFKDAPFDVSFQSEGRR